MTNKDKAEKDRKREKKKSAASPQAVTQRQRELVRVKETPGRSPIQWSKSHPERKE